MGKPLWPRSGWLPRGHTIGADKPLVLKKPTRVAVLPVGYQNGFGVERPRQSGLTALLAQWRRSRRRTVRVGEQRARVLGPRGCQRDYSGCNQHEMRLWGFSGL